MSLSMMGPGLSTSRPRGRAWLALAILPMLSGCLGLVAVPLVAGGSLTLATRHRVRAATEVRAPKERKSAAQASSATLTSLKQLPAPSGASAADDPWQRFFAYALAQASGKPAKDGHGQSALLAPNPTIVLPVRRDCSTKVPAVVIDIDDDATAFAPEKLQPAPAAVTHGLAQLREAGIVVLWISQLPASRATDVAAALRTSGLDPQGMDQLLLIRSAGDRKQLLRDNANDDVCVIAIAGDTRGDFDELFDYLRNPGSAVGLYPMMGHGWFLVPRLDGSAADEK